MVDSLKVGISDSFSQCANEGIEQWVVQQNPNMPEVTNVATVAGIEPNQPAVNVGIDTSGMETLSDDAIDVGMNLQTQSADSLFGIAEICKCVGDEITEARDLLNNKVEPQITMSNDGGAQMEVTQIAKTWDPAMSPNSPFG